MRSLAAIAVCVLLLALALIAQELTDSAASVIAVVVAAVAVWIFRLQVVGLLGEPEWRGGPPSPVRVGMQLVCGLVLVIGVPLDLALEEDARRSAIHIAWLALLFVVGVASLVASARALTHRN